MLIVSGLFHAVYSHVNLYYNETQYFNPTKGERTITYGLPANPSPAHETLWIATALYQTLHLN
jgi:hypothetical protein